MLDLIDIANTFRLLILDDDYTIIEPRISGKRFRLSATDWQFIPNRLQILHELYYLHVQIALAVNAPGVAFGYLNETEFEHQLRQIQMQINASLAFACYQHPESPLSKYKKETFWRKPNPGMLQTILFLLNISAKETLVIGENYDTQIAAKRAGCYYVAAHDFFKS